MTTVEDFTRMRPGTKVANEGEVTLCSKCGRPGIEHHDPAEDYFCHVQTTEILPDGMLTEVCDCCRLPHGTN